MIATLWSLLVECTLATSGAVVLAWTLRSAVARRFGFGAAHALWSVVPLSLLAVLLPAQTLESSSAVVPQVLRQSHAIALATPALATSGWLVTAWALGAVATLMIQLHRQRRFAVGLGPLRLREDGIYSAANASGLPAVSGLLRHRIIVPSTFNSRYTPQERELVLYHERVHLRRGDLHANALAMLLRSLFWFNPLLQLAAHRFRQDQELACDEAVLTRFPHSRRVYGEAMLKTQLAARPLPLACHWNGAHPLKERIAMLKNPVPTRRRSIAGSCAVLLLCTCASLVTWAAQPAAINGGEPAVKSMPDEIQGSPPTYPLAAAEGNMGGKVVLLIDVAADGSVVDAIVESSTPVGVFDSAALQAARQWKFQPAMEDGKAVAGRVRVPVDFSPDGPPAPDANGSNPDQS